MGLTMKEKKSVTREYQSRYLKMSKKQKHALLDEFLQLTGYHRKYAIRILGAKPVKQVTIYTNGGAVIIKPEKKKRPANEKENGSTQRKSSKFSVSSGYFSTSSVEKSSPPS